MVAGLVLEVAQEHEVHDLDRPKPRGSATPVVSLLSAQKKRKTKKKTGKKKREKKEEGEINVEKKNIFIRAPRRKEKDSSRLRKTQ